MSCLTFDQNIRVKAKQPIFLQKMFFFQIKKKQHGRGGSFFHSYKNVKAYFQKNVRERRFFSTEKRGRRLFQTIFPKSGLGRLWPIPQGSFICIGAGGERIFRNFQIFKFSIFKKISYPQVFRKICSQNVWKIQLFLIQQENGRTNFRPASKKKKKKTRTTNEQFSSVQQLMNIRGF